MSPVADTFRSLRVRNYRLYFFGQLVSVCGTWMQMIAQIWLMTRLTHNSGTALGLLVALQFLPLLLAGAWGGLIVDRNDKRTILFITQSAAGVLAVALGLLTVTHHASVLAVDGLAFVLGWVNVFDNPARQAFAHEMVGTEDVANAISLNSVMFNSGRIIGPALAGIAIKTIDVGPCFFVNAFSYVAVIGALMMMDVKQLHRAAPTRRGSGQLREGFRYVWSTPALRVPLLMMAVVGTLAFNFQVVAPLIVKKTFHQDVGAFTTVMTLSGVGAVLGGLTTAQFRRPTARIVAVVAIVMGLSELAAALAPTLAYEALAMMFLGGSGMAFVAMSNASLQIAADPAMRGRVMALFGIAFLGSTPIGGPIVGWASNQFGPRAGFLIGAAAAIAAGVAALPVRTRVPAGTTVNVDIGIDEPAIAVG